MYEVRTMISTLKKAVADHDESAEGLVQLMGSYDEELELCEKQRREHLERHEMQRISIETNYDKRSAFITGRRAMVQKILDKLVGNMPEPLKLEEPPLQLEAPRDESPGGSNGSAKRPGIFGRRKK